VQLKIDNSIYDNVMFLLKNLKLKGLEIQEDKDRVLDFSKYEVKSFENIKDPVKWQKNIRSEWN
jgi:energy-coupling factor transporter ATP-binding protein EcfA2